MGANIGFLFYKEYFKDLDYKDLKNKSNEDKVKKQVQNIINQTPQISEATILGNTHFKATTSYPGLILGSGNAHELPSIEGQAILGFSFDYTSGLPIIAGSSVKGVLRSALKHPTYIKEFVGENIDIQALETEIFDNGDIFFDATIEKADSFGKILGDDFLAPHGADPLKNPIPLRFIKVLPGVSFRFDFELNDGSLTKEQKSKLFQNILADLGLGAKTNVGYGKFDKFAIYKTDAEKEDEKFDDICKSDNIQTIKNFIKANQTHPKVTLLEEKIATLEKAQLDNKFAKVNEEAQKSFDTAISQKDKNIRKKYLTSWIKSWEKEEKNNNSPFVLELIEKARKEL